jgi:signal peptidase I
MMELAFWTTLLVLVPIGLMVGLHRGTGNGGHQRLSLPRSILVVLLIGLVTGGLLWGLRTLTAAGLVSAYAALGALVAIVPLASFLALTAACGFRPNEGLRALRALGVAAVIAAFVAAVPLSFVWRNFAITSNAMAPTLKGRHLRDVCELCGEPTIVSAFQDDFDRSIRPAETGICTSCLRVNEARDVKLQPWMGDRIVVNQLARPRRWDLIVFRFPLNPQVQYVKRLVALPGETVEIRDGSVWIDGQELAPPPDVGALRWYEGEGSYPTYAIRGEPLTLGDGEYFVLGDHSPSSYDSRYWGAVPAANVIGVVDYIYWPPRSWRSLPRH